MPFEAGAAIAIVVMAVAFIIDWPRSLAGLVLGAVARFLPYATIIVPIGVVLIAAAGELLYPELGRSSAPSWGSFAIGLFSVAANASGLYVTIRNLRDRL